MRVLLATYGANILVIFLDMLHVLLLSIVMKVLYMTSQSELGFVSLVAYVTW